MNHVTIIHGIHTGLTDPNWTHRFHNLLEIRMDRVAIETESYPATAIAPWNIWVKNPRYAKAHAERIKAFSDNYTRERLPETAVAGSPHLPSLKVHLVAHSNGTNIAVETVKRLAAMRIKVETLILVGSAVHSYVERSGLDELVKGGHLGRVFAYCSDDDSVIRPLQSIPGFYGSLGTRGLESRAAEKSRTTGLRSIGLRVEGYDDLEKVVGWGVDRFHYITRWFDGFSHSEWMNERREETFAAFMSDMRLSDEG